MHPDGLDPEGLLDERGRVVAFARFLLRDQDQADDVAQDVFVAALAHLSGAPGRPRAWLSTVTRNAVRRLWRDATRRERRERRAARAEDQPSVLDAVERREVQERVRRAVDRLPDALRRAVLLRYSEGLSVGEVAARLEIPHETARSRLRLARARLRSDLASVAGGVAPLPAIGSRWFPPEPAEVLGSGVGKGTAVAMAATIPKAAVWVGLPLLLGASFYAGNRTAPRAATRADEPVAASSPGTRSPAAPTLVGSADLETATRARDLARATVAAQAEQIRRLTAEIERLRGAAEAVTAHGSTSGETPDDEVRRATRDRIVAGLRAARGSPDHETAIRDLAEYLARSADADDAAGLRWGGDLLDGEARRARVTAAEAALLQGVFERRAQGDAARPALAKGIGAGYAGDPRLETFLARLAPTETPVHDALLRVLDHDPSEVFASYVVGLVRDADARAVLWAALDEDRITAVVTAHRGAELALAIDDRVRDGSAAARERSDLYRGLTLLALRDPDDALPRLRAFAATEAAADLAARLREAVGKIESHEADAKSLSQLFR